MIALSELRKLPLHEKLEMMEFLWEEISPSESELDVPTWHKDILDEREMLLQQGKAKFIDWEIAKQQILDEIS